VRSLYQLAMNWYYLAAKEMGLAALTHPAKGRRASTSSGGENADGAREISWRNVVEKPPQICHDV
jgi:hypothetical protein